MVSLLPAFGVLFRRAHLADLCYFVLRRLGTGKSKIGSEIMEIVGIRIRFPQTAPLFCYGTKNGCNW